MVGTGSPVSFRRRPPLALRGGPDCQSSATAVTPVWAHVSAWGPARHDNHEGQRMTPGAPTDGARSRFPGHRGSTEAGTAFKDSGKRRRSSKGVHCGSPLIDEAGAQERSDRFLRVPTRVRDEGLAPFVSSVPGVATEARKGARRLRRLRGQWRSPPPTKAMTEDARGPGPLAGTGPYTVVDRISDQCARRLATTRPTPATPSRPTIAMATPVFAPVLASLLPSGFFPAAGCGCSAVGCDCSGVGCDWSGVGWGCSGVGWG